MSSPKADLQLEFYELLKNDPLIFQWISENIVNGIWYGTPENPENLWISDSFWKTLGYQDSEKSTFKHFEEILADSEGMNAFNLLKESAHPNINFEVFFKFKNKSHDVVLLEGRARIIKKGPDSSAKILIIYTNISKEEEKAQLYLNENNSLKELNEIFEEVNNMTRTGGWVMDLEQNSLLWTKVTKDIHEVPNNFSPDLESAINFYKEGESREKIRHLFNLTLTQGISFDTELQIVTAKGNEIWVRAYGKPELKNGKCIKVHGAFQDIDSKIKRELEFKSNKDRFQQIFDSSPIGIILAGPQNQILMSNLASYKIFGFSAGDEEEVSKITFKDIIHPEDFELANDHREQLLKGDIDSYKLELRYYNKAKEIIWCDVNVSIIRGEQEINDIVVTQVEDITNRKLLEKHAEETGERFKNAFEFSPNGMAMVSLDGKWLKVNRILSKLLGYSQKEFLSFSFNEVTHPEDVLLDLELIKELVSGKIRSYKIEKRYIQKDGSVVYGLISVSLLRNSEGIPLYFIAQINDISESVKAKEALKTSLNELQILMDATTQVAIIETDLQGNIRKFNKGAENLLGYTSEEVVEREKIIKFHDSEEISKRLGELDFQDAKNLNEFEVLTYNAMQGKFDSNEWTYTKKDGSKFPVQLVTTSITNNEGYLIGYLGIATDISRVKNIENELSESEQRLHFALEGSGDGVWDWDIPNGKQYMSDQAKKMLGFEPEESLTDIEEWDNRIHPDEREKSDRALEDYFEGKAKEYNIEKRVRTKDGNYKWILDRGKIIDWDANGKPLRMIGTQSDISERKNAEQLIRENEERFRSLYELSPVGIGLIAAKSGKFLNANKALLKSVGYTAAEMATQHFHDFISKENPKEKMDQLDQFVKSGTKEAFESILLKKGNIPFPVSLNGVKIKNAFGEKVILATIQDITQRKKMENSLLDAKLKAETANKSKSEFLANMSHEIRTPLNGVIGFTDLLMKTELNSSQEQYMKTVYNSANSLLDLINDILDFSKIEAGKLEISVEKTDLLDLCGQTVDIIKHQAHEKKLEVLLNISSEINRYIYADAVRLRQVITNLLGNAVKFTESGEVELKIDATPVGNDHEMLYTFIIRDTGIGIAPNNLKKIFNAFDQEDSSTTRKYGGTGLGLTISNKLLGLMDSKLELKSELGVGSEFSFQIVFDTEAGDNSLQENSKAIKKVLVIDDNKNNRIILKEMLAIGKIESVLASNGIEALQELEGNSIFDLAIVDFNMPYMNGVELIGHIRKKLNFDANKLPIILLHSSADDEKIHQACRDLNVQFNITKPIQIDQLFNMMKNIKVPVSYEKESILEHRTEETNLIFNILVAEDNPVNKFLAKTIIRKALPNANILEADDGQEAVDMFKSEDIDLIFMDVQMPILSGFEATMEIRELEEDDKRIPIIALTARTVKGEKERCVEYGMDDYVTKPVVFNTISDIISKYLIVPSSSKEEDLKISQQTQSSMHFDKIALLETLEGDKEGYLQLMEMVRSTLNSLQIDLKEAISNQDLDKVRKVAHSLKGTSLNCKFNTLKDLSECLEEVDTQEKVLLLKHQERIDQEIANILDLI